MSVAKKFKLSNDCAPITDFECISCYSIVRDPIELPCGVKICRHHAKLSNKQVYFNCKLCLKVHILSLKISNKDKDKEEAQRVISQEELQVTLKDLEKNCQLFKHSNRDYFEELENKVLFHKEELKTKIDHLSNEIIGKIREKKNYFDCKNKLIRNSLVTGLSLDEAELKLDELEHMKNDIDKYEFVSNVSPIDSKLLGDFSVTLDYLIR